MERSLRSPLLRQARFGAVLFLSIAPAMWAQSAQTPAPTTPPVPRDEIVAFAKTHVAITVFRDSLRLLAGAPGSQQDTTLNPQRARLRAKIAEVLHHAGMTDEDFRRKTYVVSFDDAARAIFDTVVSQLTGMPLAAKLPPAAGSIKVPAGAVGMHVGHVVNAFGDTPAKQGLLPMAMDEAKVAIAHAALAQRAAGAANLDGMKLHAGHVIHALDPTIVTSGPGLGYGVKKAALGIAMHIELAAKADSASSNVITHSAHVAMAARSTAARADQIVALARKIQAATSAEEAAPLVAQLVSATQQLVAGVDANGDGRISWEMGEGGLQQAQDHITLLLAGTR